MTPTYPKWRQAYMDDLAVTTMHMFNRRSDVEYYEIAVFDEDWNPIPFVTSYTVFRLQYLERTTFDVYIRERDISRAEYICSRSKMTERNPSDTNISSMICSRFKE
jgi:hypothetical protein